MSRIRLAAAVLAGLAFVAAAPFAASAQPVLSDGDARMRISLRQDIPRLSGTATVRVIDGNGTHIVGVGLDRPMVPASTMKVVTATTALMTMGAAHRFTTKVVRGASRNELVIVGGGDPLLDDSTIRRLADRTARALEQSGRTGAVTIRLDDTLYPSPTAATGWMAGDYPTYAAPVRSLGMLYDYSWDTAANAAGEFVSALRAAGVDASYGGRKAAATSATTLAEVSPHTVGAAVRTMLIYSENNVAEQLYRHVALATGNEPTWQGARQAARTTLLDLRIPVRGLSLRDGSGLSMNDRLTVRALTMIIGLEIDGRHPELSKIVSERWLPTAGRTGTLANRFWAGGSACAVGNVFAKTGSLSGVQTLAGLTRGADGNWKIFAVMVNDAYADARPVIDEMAAEVNGCLAA